MEFMPWNVLTHFLGADFKNRCYTEDYGGKSLKLPQNNQKRTKPQDDVGEI
jgi:hypothetical protein